MSATESIQPARGALAQLANHLRAGNVYRREDLARRSTAVDRHLRELVATGRLKKLAQGLYHAPGQSSFGPLPPADEEVVAGFLRDKDFLVFSPSVYNTVGLGTTQLYNRTLVYNHKRHGVFKLGNRWFDFRMKARFPRKLTPEFLYVPPSDVFMVAESEGAIPYDIPDVELSHVGERCSFDAFLEKYGLHDAALAHLAEIIRGADTSRLDLTPQSAGLHAVSLGLSATFTDDHEMLMHGMVLYDALYAWCESCQGETHNWPPATG